MSVYFATEKRSYREYDFLRIHPQQPVLGERSRCIWFEKRLPGGLHPEDLVPWFKATIERLPKKARPHDVGRWTRRLCDCEPDLLRDRESNEGKTWVEKAKIILVFGAIGKVGYRSLFHLERRDVARIVRKGEIVTIAGKTRHRYADGTCTELERVFHLLTLDDEAAVKIERELLHGNRIHFGLDGTLLGMICTSGGFIHAINAPLETIRKLCLKGNEVLTLESRPQEKHKLYYIESPQNSEAAT